ncbi:glycosyltransferase family 2 protein [Micromonospora sp. RTGN7]|uniref:glycosyltransferase family 2 protein n=1 Tax=Micromonospora sp. RTGN7 TaxID=3016526 RepID=UPI0029FF0487|nr:glycosyltransferase family 2 protein [Micromonospora sp. RTGN7]
MRPRVTVVIPVYNEGADVVRCLDRILREVLLPAEVLIVHDMPEDTTVPYAEEVARRDPRVRPVLNTYGSGPANAIRFGIDAAQAPVAVVTMADGCDDPRQIDELARLVDRGVVVAAASRYMPGGQQVGGPRFKRMASRWAGRTLWLLARVGTRDATNSFKAYDTDFVREVGIESRTGFEIGIELTAKATRLRRPVAEIPTIWLDRQLGESHFDLGRFLPSYLRWYFFAFGRRLTTQQLAARWEARRPAPAAPAPDVATGDVPTDEVTTGGVPTDIDVAR